MTDEYPSACLRGLRKSDFVTDGPAGEKTPTAIAFEPDPNTTASRADGMMETSISWEDSDSVLSETAKQPNALYGVARTPTERLRYWQQQFKVKDHFGFERSPVLGNPHLGNLLFAADLVKLPKKVRTMITNALALESTIVQT